MSRTWTAGARRYARCPGLPEPHAPTRPARPGGEGRGDGGLRAAAGGTGRGRRGYEPSVNAVAWSTAHWRNVRGAVPRMSATAVVMYAGCPTAALHAASSMSTTELGTVPSHRLRNSSGVISSNAIRRPRASPMTSCRERPRTQKTAPSARPRSGGRGPLDVWSGAQQAVILGGEDAGGVTAAAEDTTDHRAVSCSGLAVRVPAGVLSTRGRWTCRCSTSTSRPRSRSARARSSVRPLARWRPPVLSPTPSCCRLAALSAEPVHTPALRQR